MGPASLAACSGADPSGLSGSGARKAGAKRPFHELIRPRLRRRLWRLGLCAFARRDA
jgi:hypothetical protein